MGKWSWRHSDWPNFTWDRQQTQALITKALTENSVSSFAIQGEHLDRNAVYNEFERVFVSTDCQERARNVGVKEANAAALMSDVFNDSSSKLSFYRLGSLNSPWNCRHPV